MRRISSVQILAWFQRLRGDQTERRRLELRDFIGGVGRNWCNRWLSNDAGRA